MSENMDGKLGLRVDWSAFATRLIYANAVINIYHCQAGVCIFYDTNDRTCYFDLNHANDLKSLT